MRFHVGLAETTGSLALVSAMTEAQGAVGALIDHIAHPPEVLASSNLQHRQLLAAVRAGDVERAARVVTEHLEGTVHVLAGLLPVGGRITEGDVLAPPDEALGPRRSAAGHVVLGLVGAFRPAGARRAAVLRPVRRADARRRARSTAPLLRPRRPPDDPGGLRRDDPEPPPWWPEFERDFRAYASRPRTRA